MKAVTDRSAAGRSVPVSAEPLPIPATSNAKQVLEAVLTTDETRAPGESSLEEMNDATAAMIQNPTVSADTIHLGTEVKTDTGRAGELAREQQTGPVVIAVPPPLRPPPAPAAGSEELRSIMIPPGTPSKEFAVPAPPEGWAKTRWLGVDETVEIGGVTIRGGLFYTGIKLDTPSGDTEPSLVNSVLAVAPYGDYRGSTGYWHGYAQLSPSERRAYLNWLASDRSDSNCSISYVRLYFFGLERRVLLDSITDPDSKKDWPAIKQALRKLGAAYGDIHGPIRGYTSSLLDWMALDTVEEKLYTKPVPQFERSYELPFYVRLALGQCSLDRAPIPAPLALAWIRLNPEVSLRTAAVRCADEFDRLFLERYRELFGDGMVLPKNRTMLKFARQPASPAFYGRSPKPKTFGDVPDVTTLRAPLKGLLEVVQQCTDELGAYSRMVGRSPDAKDSLQALLLLSPTIWPESQMAKLRSIADDLQAGNLTTHLVELSARLGASDEALGRERLRELARALEAVHVGMEPNVLEGARPPSETGPIVLFGLLPGQSHKTDAEAYQMAVLTLQLASTVAQSDGSFSSQELSHLSLEIDGWSHLSAADHRRLRAHLDLLSASPITLQSMRKKLDPLDSATKEAIAASMATLAQVDGMVSPEEVRFLEKVYKALGVEPKRVFSDIHAQRPNKSLTQSDQPTSLQLDPERIAALQRDTAKVSALLANIFAEEEPDTVHELLPAAPVDEEPEISSGLLGLDEAHSAFLRLMLSRPSWTRAELEDGAADIELMLDGALEQINDASFDAYDIPFSDGDDPLEINPEFIEKIEQ